MAREDQQDRFDQAFDHIEGTILPCIAIMLETLVETAELGGTAVSPQAYSAELRTLGLQLEALTRELERASPARPDAPEFRRIATG